MWAKKQWGRLRRASVSRPYIYDIGATVFETSAYVEWRVADDFPATGQVEYGTTTAYGNTTTLEDSYLTFHRQLLSPLQASTTYHYRVTSVTENGTTMTSDDETFTTLGSSATAVGPRPFGPLPTGANVKTISGTVDDSGNTDVTTQLQSFINSANAGDTLVFAQSSPEGNQWGIDDAVSTYRISGSLLLNTLPNNVTLHGDGVKIVQAPLPDLNAPIIYVNKVGMSGLTIRGFQIQGRNEPYNRTQQIYSALKDNPNEHGIAFYRPHYNSTIEDVWLHGIHGDAINQPRWGPGVWDWTMVRDCTIRYCTVTDFARQGMTIQCGVNWDVHHNLIEHGGLFSIDAEDVNEDLTSVAVADLPSLSIDIHHNEFGPSGWANWGATFNGDNICINYTWGWNDPDYPYPNFNVLGPITIRENTVTGFVPSGSAWQAGDGARFVGRGVTQATQDFVSSSGWYGFTVVEEGIYILDNVMDVPAGEQTSAFLLGYIRGQGTAAVVVDGNTLQGSQGLYIDTSGYGACTNVSGSNT